MSKRGLSRVPPVGTKVRVTGYYLRATGSREGHSRWLTVACPCELCASGAFAAVDEALTERDPDQSPWRHFALGNLEIVGAKPKAADQADAVGPIKVLR